jgi:hypothetical protein
MIIVNGSFTKTDTWCIREEPENYGAKLWRCGISAVRGSGTWKVLDYIKWNREMPLPNKLVVLWSTSQETKHPLMERELVHPAPFGCSTIVTYKR